MVFAWIYIIAFSKVHNCLSKIDPLIQTSFMGILSALLSQLGQSGRTGCV